MADDFIKKVLIDDAPAYYVEDIESITIFPATKKVDVQLTRRYYTFSDVLVRTESGNVEEFTHDLTSFVNSARQILKNRLQN
ncbi:MAG: hypothetical protein DRJ03_03545 [Chloroflexi bacterium]|nr:MAG: hypothetical protein DRJ03_03545 [Chloroflexota bacterium]